MCNAFFSRLCGEFNFLFDHSPGLVLTYTNNAPDIKNIQKTFIRSFLMPHIDIRDKTLEHIPTPTLTTSQLQKQIVLFYLHILTSLTMLLKVLSYLYVITTAWCLQHHLFHYQRLICHFFCAHGHRKRRRLGRICVDGRWKHKTTV